MWSQNLNYLRYNLEFNDIPYDGGCNHVDEAKTKGGYNTCMIDEMKQYCI